MRNLLLAISISAAAATSVGAPSGEYVGLSPKDLQKVERPQTVTLSEQISWSRAAKNTELGILPASYVAHWQDADGQFFLADKPVVYMRTVRGKYLLSKGGVMLPHATTGKPRFFLVQEGTLRQGSTLAEAVANAPQESVAFPLLDALLNWATDGRVTVLAEIDNDEVGGKVRVLFTP